MNSAIILTMIFNIIGGLAIFLLGMDYMSTGLQSIAGARLRKLIAAVTNNRIFAALVGTGVTVVIQSSSVTTVMVVGFVNSGLMSLNQALGVIFGANIGTTITGWILVLDIGKYGLPILGVAGLVYLFSKRDKDFVRFTAMSIMGVGMIFFGLQMMTSGLAPVREIPEFVQFFSLFQADTFLGVLKCVFAGALLTAIVQSSSATLGITISLAVTGNIPFETAAALVLGENIGTTITAMLASINTSANARRAALGHLLFNVIGCAWIVLIFQPYAHFITFLVERFQGGSPTASTMVDGKIIFPYVTAAIALTHSCFNIANTIAFLPFLGILARLLEKLIPVTKNEDGISRLTSLESITLFESPTIAYEEAKAEVDRMGNLVVKMSDDLLALMRSEEYDEEAVRTIFEAEEALDVYQCEVSKFLVDLLGVKSISHDTVNKIQCLFRIADEYESISDYITSILKRLLVLRDEDAKISGGKFEDVQALHLRTSEYLRDLAASVQLADYSHKARLLTEYRSVKQMFKEKRGVHLERLATDAIPPLEAVNYMDILTCYRKVNDHLLNITEVLNA